MKGERAVAFASADEAASSLTTFASAFRYPCVDLTPEAIACASAESAWMKALIRKRGGEGDFFGRWASETVPRMAKSARYVINQEQFDILVRRTGLDLLRSWRGSRSAPPSA
jgi:formate-dependent nitrite reductase cytochrome c552 subunit